VRQDEGLADQGTSHLIEIADLDELELPVEAEGADQRQLWILLVEAVDLMQRGLDGETTMPIDGGGPAEAVVALENQHAQTRSGTKRAGRQAAQSRANRDRIKFSAHSQAPVQAKVAPRRFRPP
jgi:hypothetical protein